MINLINKKKLIDIEARLLFGIINIKNTIKFKIENTTLGYSKYQKKGLFLFLKK